MLQKITGMNWIYRFYVQQLLPGSLACYFYLTQVDRLACYQPATIPDSLMEWTVGWVSG